MKKYTALFLALVLILSLMSGCNAEPVETTQSTTAPTQGTTAATEPPVAEISYPEKVSVWTNLGGNQQGVGMTSNGEAYFSKYWEELTGTDIEWEDFSGGTKAEKFTLMIGGGEPYPDAIVYNWEAVEGGPELYYEDGIIVDLTDLIPECMPNLNAYLEAYPNIKARITNEEGQILYIPTIREDPELLSYLGPSIRTDWLEKLELDVPKTTEDLYNVLKAFKEKDPNGNGEPDEIPMSGTLFANYYSGIGCLTWAFDTHWDLYVEDGKVVYGPAEAKFADALAYIAKLFDEDLIDVDYLLNDTSAMRSKVVADRVGYHFNYQNTFYYNNAEFNDGTKRMTGIPYLTEPGNESLLCFNKTYEDQTVPSTSIAFTTSCEDIKSVLKWFDCTYDEEFNTVCVFGEEGVHFDYVNGKPVLKEMDAEARKDYYANTTINGSPISTVLQWEAHGASLSEWGFEDSILWAECADISGILPSGMRLTAAEKEEIADALTQVATYADTQINKIILGELSMDAWDGVVEKFYDMGLEDILEVYNAAYQRYLAA